MLWNVPVVNMRPHRLLKTTPIPYTIHVITTKPNAILSRPSDLSHFPRHLEKLQPSTISQSAGIGEEVSLDGHSYIVSQNNSPPPTVF